MPNLGLRLQGASAFLLVLATFSTTACQARNVSIHSLEAHPSVVLITIDTLRADHLSGYGYTIPTSPNLDAFMAKGVQFTNAFSPAPCTAPSHASIMTGLYPSFHSVGAYNGIYALSSETETLAEIAGRNGCTTAAIVSNPVLSKALGLNQGFQSYDDHLDGKELNRPDKEQYANTAVDKALAKMEEFTSDAFFLWLHLHDPHGPYVPPESWDGFRDRDYADAQFALPVGEDHSGYRAIPAYQVYYDVRRYGDYVRRYDSEIAFADHELSRLFDALERTGRLASTMVIVTADHGEAFGEDGFYFAHSHSVGTDQVHVPLLMVGPGIPEGRVVSEPVSTRAVFATVLDFLGVPSPARGWADSLLPLAKGEESRKAQAVYVESLNQVGIVFRHGFLRRDRRPKDDAEFWAAPNPASGSFWKPLGEQYFRLSEPAELSHKDNLERLAEMLSVFDEKAKAFATRIRDGEEVRYSQEQIRALQALGYAR